MSNMDIHVNNAISQMNEGILKQIKAEQEHREKQNLVMKRIRNRLNNIGLNTRIKRNIHIRTK